MLTARPQQVSMDLLKVLLALLEVPKETLGPVLLPSLCPLQTAKDLFQHAGLLDRETQIVQIMACVVLMAVLIHVEKNPELKVRHKLSLL